MCIHIQGKYKHHNASIELLVGNILVATEQNVHPLLSLVCKYALQEYIERYIFYTKE